MQRPCNALPGDSAAYDRCPSRLARWEQSRSHAPRIEAGLGGPDCRPSGRMTGTRATRHRATAPRPCMGPIDVSGRATGGTGMLKVVRLVAILSLLASGLVL